MKLSMASRYALHALAHLAADAGDKPVTAEKIAAEQKIPESFLGKVLKPLVSAGFLRSLKGPSGGYRLAKPAGKISVLEVVEAVDGPVRGQAPLPAEPVEVREDLDARLTAVCDKAAAAVRKHLSKVSIADLLDTEET